MVPQVRRILRSGGRAWGMGGDYGFGWNPHGDYARELTFFVQDMGFAPLEVIMCATKTGAEIMGRGEEFGTLEAGKLADILVVDGDVLANIFLARTTLPIYRGYASRSRKGWPVEQAVSNRGRSRKWCDASMPQQS